jgi:Na+-driven multidrug efflux pump
VKNGTTIDMTHGPLLGKILLFSLPLMASNVLQLLFNAADIVVVGRFAGHESLAAVGSTVSVIYLFVNLLIGLSVGVNVIIARYLGLTGYEREISRMLHTAVTIALAGGAILGAIGIAVAGWVLDLISVPAAVRPLAAVYMRIYFIGTPFNMLYNYGAAALRAKGIHAVHLFSCQLAELST